MVKCEICDAEFRAIKQSHLNKHNISREEYSVKYPNAQLVSDETKELSSQISKKLWNNSEWRDNCRSLMTKTDEQKEALSKSTKQAHVDGKFRHIYTKDRNKKIAIAKRDWWEEHPEKKNRVSTMWIDLKNNDEQKWLSQLRKNASLGLKANLDKNKSAFQSKFEEFLKNKNINFISEYQLDGKFYDIYLTDKHVLIELDGDFYHKDTIEECKYDIQKNNFSNDRKKDNIAKFNHIKLVRIKESQFDTYMEGII